jgi:hypothetical protein
MASRRPPRKARKKADPKPKRSRQVPGQFYGYSIQETRLLARLLVANKLDAVSIEHLDDVAVEGPYSTLLEQTKSGQKSNPIADRSPELWKTVAGWLAARKEGVAATSNTKFVLYVAQEHTGSVAARMSDCQTHTEALKLVEDLRNEFWGKAPQRSKKHKLASGISEYVNVVLEASDEVFASIIENFTLVAGTGSPNEDLLSQLGRFAISDAARERVLQSLLGWAKREVHRAIEAGKPAIITYDAFHKRLVAAAKLHDRSATVLLPADAVITADQVNRELEDRRYVKQLKLIQAADGLLERSVRDYLRAAVDRTSWSEAGDVVEASFAEFNETLLRTWESFESLVGLEHANKAEVERALLLLHRCLTFQARLEGKDVPSYFVPGSYHGLADALVVGWHPRFRQLMA